MAGAQAVRLNTFENIFPAISFFSLLFNSSDLWRSFPGIDHFRAYGGLVKYYFSFSSMPCYNFLHSLQRI